MNDEKIKYSVIIPIFNEEEIIKKVIENLRMFLDGNYRNKYEIIAINDGSTDGTKNILSDIKVGNYKYFSNPYNKGYGSALKLGAQKASGEYLLFFDGDGQHNPDDLKKLIAESNNYDMVVGAREGYKGPLIRQPGKKILTWLASYLVDFKIPDLNSGLRIVNKKGFMKFIHLYPNTFSLSTTITLAFLKEGLNVKYIPIKINKRVGKSTVSPRDAVNTFMLITRIIVLFSPMRFFFPVSLIFSLLFLASIVNDILGANISDTSIVLFISSIFIFFFGIIIDQVSATRRELNINNKHENKE